MAVPYVQDADFILYHGDALDVLRELPDESVDCVATSPPFFGLRDYQVEGQIGLEASPEEWVARLVAVFAECRRVLVRTGTLWIECGDSYGSDSKWGGASGNKNYTSAAGGMPRTRRQSGVKEKDLLGQPFLLAFALRADGWYWRGCYPWWKRNAMPESVTDRCTTAHSYVLHFAKEARYFFDADAIAEEFSLNTNSRGKGFGVKQTLEERSGTAHAGRSNASWGRATQADIAPHLLRQPQKETLDGSEGESPRGPDGRRATHVKGRDGSIQHRDGERWPQAGKNPRSVWDIPTAGFSEAHFATWPEMLAERIIKAGCPENGTVLDPFLGSGTTALVARKLGRRSIGIELNPDYCRMSARRLEQLSLLAEGRA